MTFYQEMQDIATSLLTEFKQGVIQYVNVTPGAGPIDNPGASTLTPIALKGAVIRGVSEKYVRMSLAVETDMQVSMAVQSGVVPNMKDFIRADGVDYKITRIMPKPAAGTVVAYILIVGKA